MTDKINKDADNPQDSLVDALESIKALLAKNDSKLAAARESIAIASNQTALGHLGIQEQSEIPVLDDIVVPAEEVSNLSAKPDPEIILSYLDTLQTKLEKTLRDSLMKSIVTIEAGLKKSLISEIDEIRKQVKKDFG